MTITWTDFQPHPGDTNGAETAFTAANGGEGEGNRTSLGVREDNLREDKSFSSFFCLSRRCRAPRIIFFLKK